MSETNKASNAIKINFDVTYNPEEPTLILAKKNGDKLGKINAKSIEVSDNMNNASEITFNVYKEIDGEKDALWDLITNFKLVYCVEWNKWFEAIIEVDESNETVKTVFCTLLGVAELSQINLYNVEINTETDIERDDYVLPTVLYREEPENKSSSLMHRILEKAPHYSVIHVDDTIKNMQRTFDFDDASIYDACQEIAEELNCLFVFNSNSDDNGKIQRTISIYDLESNCLNPKCKHRGEFFDVCPECGGKDENGKVVYGIEDGYGEDTTIFVAADEIADEIQLTTDTDAIKNCFKLEAGDDLMTATIRNCNPNGSDYIWYLSDDMKADMSDKLVDKIDEYNSLYDYYQNDHIFYSLDGEVVSVDAVLGDTESLTLATRGISGSYSKNIRYSDSYEVDIIKGAVSLAEPVTVGTFTNTSLLDDEFSFVKLRGKYIDIDGAVYLMSANSSFSNVNNTAVINGQSVLIGYKLVASQCNKLIVQGATQRTPLLTEYNNLVKKYQAYNEDLETINLPVKGFSNLMNVYYNTFDLYLYLQSGLMPSIGIARPSIEDEIAKLTAANLSPVAVNVASTSSNPLKAASISTVDNLVLQMAKALVDSRYKVKIADNSALGFYVDGEYLIDNQENKSKYVDGMLKYWRGKIILTAYSDDEITATTEQIEVEVNADYETFIRRKLDKALSDENDEDVSISGLFKKEWAASLTTSDGMDLMDSNGSPLVVGENEDNSFQFALKKYSLNRLLSFYDACQTCIDIMIEQGVADSETWGDVEGDSNLYENLYVPYYNKLNAIASEITIRESEIATIVGIYDEDGDLKTAGLQNIIEDKKSEIQRSLNFEAFLGEELWLEFCFFRREDKYSNDNYVSDGLNNAEIIAKANEFIQVAEKEIFKSAELQCSISADLKNLLVIEKFKPLVKSFKVGNWLRVMVDDRVYKLRLISYDIDYDNLDSISVEFSDTVRANSTIKSVQDVLAQASSMATSYSAIQRQAKQGEESKSLINDWVSSGLDATNVKIMGGADGQTQTWDNHGMLFREYDEANGEYLPEQLKIINSTMAITDDNWETTKTAVGKYYYSDPETGELKMAYGVNAETIIGKFILGENMSIQNESGSMAFDGEGLTIESGSGDNAGKMTFNESGLMVEHGDNNYVKIDPSTEEIMNIVYGGEEVFEVNEKGLTINGNIMARSLSLDSEVRIDQGVIDGLHPVAISGSYTSLEDEDELAKVADLNAYAKTSDLTPYAKTENLATIATSGNYTDLIGDSNNAGNLLYVGTNGKVTTLTIAGLKTLLESV